jgi:hypothetical protein
MSNIRKGSLAICSLGCLGLITEDSPREVVYKDGNKGVAWVGIHLTDKIAPIGSPWSSRNPKIVGHIEEFLPHPPSLGISVGEETKISEKIG